MQRTLEITLTETYTYIPPIISKASLPLAPYFQEKYPTQKPIGKTDLSIASCLLAWLPYSKGFYPLQKPLPWYLVFSVVQQANRAHLLCYTIKHPLLSLAEDGI